MNFRVVSIKSQRIIAPASETWAVKHWQGFENTIQSIIVTSTDGTISTCYSSLFWLHFHFWHHSLFSAPISRPVCQNLFVIGQFSVWKGCTLHDDSHPAEEVFRSQFDLFEVANVLCLGKRMWNLSANDPTFFKWHDNKTKVVMEWRNYLANPIPKPCTL